MGGEQEKARMSSQALVEVSIPSILPNTTEDDSGKGTSLVCDRVDDEFEVEAHNEQRDDPGADMHRT
eukprot:747169-Hanusia_phi.AAC.1